MEFTEYFPENTQGVLVQPVGDEGVLVVATDTQRGFGRLDQVRAARSHYTCRLRTRQSECRHAGCIILQTGTALTAGVPQEMHLQE